MPEQLGVNIRKFRPADREEVRRIVFDTAFMGEAASAFFEGEEIISDALSLYFTDYEPQSCFVAEVSGKLAGYLIGAKEKKASEKIIGSKIAPNLLWKSLISGALFRKKNLTLIFNCLSDMFRGGFKTPDVTKEYPATFHINLKKKFRGLRIGSRLIESFLQYLKEEKIPGVHLATMSDHAARFFEREGFSLLHRGKRTYFKHILHQDIPLYIYGKKL